MPPSAKRAVLSRTLLGLASLCALAWSTPAHAQARFVAACTVAAEAEGLAAPAPTCECVAGQMQAAVPGLTGADLDAILDSAGQDGQPAPDAPAMVQQAARSLGGALAACAAGSPDAASTPPRETTPGRTTAGETGGSASTGATVPPRRVPPSGLRTGNGTGPVRTSQPGTGAAIRIVG